MAQVSCGVERLFPRDSIGRCGSQAANRRLALIGQKRLFAGRAQSRRSAAQTSVNCCVAAIAPIHSCIVESGGLSRIFIYRLTWQVMQECSTGVNSGRFTHSGYADSVLR